MQKKMENTAAGTPIRAIRSFAPKEFLSRNGLVDRNYRAASAGAYGAIHSSEEMKACWKEFMVALYKDNDLQKASRAGRKMIKAASELGGDAKETIVDWIDAERYAYANSRPADGCLAPEKIMGRLLYDIPELRDSTHHKVIEKRQYEIAVAAGWGEYDKATSIAHDAAKFAWGVGNRWCAYEFELEKMHYVMQTRLDEGDLQGAISVASQAIGFSYSIGRETPDWLLECFFVYAHKQGRKPSGIRAEILAAITDFPSNHVKEIDSLKGQIERTIAYVRGEYYEAKPKEAAEMAKRLAEFTFLAPAERYDETREWIRNVFEAFSKTDNAKYNNYTPEKVRGILASQIPDIY